jgi:hypothetical protein
LSTKTSADLGLNRKSADKCIFICEMHGRVYTFGRRLCIRFVLIFDDKNDDTLVEIICFPLDFLVLVEIAKKSVK